ncbi:MAG: PA0069 family radical SAM protein [Gemmataceae bacterium]|nr:PA0069 family radical SAM protein [Gemmataceae bacterium]MDW8264967.1 PA0069 family radical SAM protein [Gemmataceae bacterium]
MADLPIRGRGAADNPPNRFDRLHYEPIVEEGDEQTPPATELYRDRTRSIITYNDSPDVGFDASINVYRGCEHGCIYCYARPYHEYLGWSAGLDFESKILVKDEAPALLRRELASSRWQPRPLAMSGVTDPYQPIERRLGLTRRCLEVLAECRNPVGIVTKNRLVTRDLDLLSELHRHQACVVYVSLTTLDPQLRSRLEPRATHPDGRLAAIRTLAQAGIPVGVLTAPVIPGLNDHELPALLRAAAKAGARFAGYTVLRLPHGVAGLFERWLEQHFPERKEKVLGRLREMHGGGVCSARFGSRMVGEGDLAVALADLFRLACRKAGLADQRPALSTASFRRPASPQKLLFD